MRAVNLMPAGAARGAGRGSAAAYMLLAALAAFVVLAGLWAVANRQAGDRRAQLDRANEQAAAAEARADAAQPYADFARLAHDRVATVSALAGSRFDWAHAMREISRLLPADVWLTELRGDAGATGATPSPTTSAAPAPTFKLDGCTRSQARVARLMARLRAVDGVRAVDLGKSQKPDAGSGGEDGCPANRASDPQFTITISFAAPGAPKDTLDAAGGVAAPSTSATASSDAADAGKSGATAAPASDEASDAQ
jgi:Tfp pilus assembly protein PilN